MIVTLPNYSYCNVYSFLPTPISPPLFLLIGFSGGGSAVPVHAADISFALQLQEEHLNGPCASHELKDPRRKGMSELTRFSACYRQVLPSI